MIDKVGKFIEKVFGAMSKAFTIAALGSMLLAASAGTPVLAHDDDESENYTYTDDFNTANPNVVNFKYTFHSNVQQYPYYNLIRDAMAPVFKGTTSDNSLKYTVNPTLAVVEFDLNGDKNTEFIAFPIESEDEPYNFCGKDMLCPHYVIDTSGTKPHVLGVVRAFAVDRGDSVKNGYWTLKAFTKQDDPANYKHFDLYVFDKKTGQYQKENAPEPEKPKQNSSTPKPAHP